ncbi:MAG: hypothetical protein ABI448_02745 [Bacteroidia bacterium]
MKKLVFVFVCLVSFALNARQPDEIATTSEGIQINRISNSDVSFQLPRFIFNYTNTRIVVKFVNPNNAKLKENNNELNFIVNGTDQKVVFDESGTGSFYYTFKNNKSLQVLIEDLNYTTQPAVISIWYIIAPLLIVLLFFMYKIFKSARNANKTSKLTVNHNSITNDSDDDLRTFTSTLKVVSVKEREERF